jgi:hypothetical protein
MPGSQDSNVHGTDSPPRSRKPPKASQSSGGTTDGGDGYTSGSMLDAMGPYESTPPARAPLPPINTQHYATLKRPSAARPSAWSAQSAEQSLNTLYDASNQSARAPSEECWKPYSTSPGPRSDRPVQQGAGRYPPQNLKPIRPRRLSSSGGSSQGTAEQYQPEGCRRESGIIPDQYQTYGSGQAYGQRDTRNARPAMADQNTRPLELPIRPNPAPPSGRHRTGSGASSDRSPPSLGGRPSNMSRDSELRGYGQQDNQAPQPSISSRRNPGTAPLDVKTQPIAIPPPPLGPGYASSASSPYSPLGSTLTPNFSPRSGKSARFGTSPAPNPRSPLSNDGAGDPFGARANQAFQERSRQPYSAAGSRGSGGSAEAWNQYEGRSVASGSANTAMYRPSGSYAPSGGSQDPRDKKPDPIQDLAASQSRADSLQRWRDTMMRQVTGKRDGMRKDLLDMYTNDGKIQTRRERWGWKPESAESQFRGVTKNLGATFVRNADQAINDYVEDCDRDPDLAIPTSEFTVRPSLASKSCENYDKKKAWQVTVGFETSIGGRRKSPVKVDAYFSDARSRGLFSR